MSQVVVGDYKKCQERLNQCLEKISSLYQIIKNKDNQLGTLDELKYQKDLLTR